MSATTTLPTLSKGDTGPDVRWAQYRLVRQTLSYTDVDGVFGQVTYRAVRLFQDHERYRCHGRTSTSPGAGERARESCTAA